MIQLNATGGFSCCCFAEPRQLRFFIVVVTGWGCRAFLNLQLFCLFCAGSANTGHHPRWKVMGDDIDTIRSPLGHHWVTVESLLGHLGRPLGHRWVHRCFIFMFSNVVRLWFLPARVRFERVKMTSRWVNIAALQGGDIGPWQN